MARNPDDIKLHLETIRDADDQRRVVPEGETEAQRIERESVVLSAALRSRVDAVHADISAQVPGLSAAEATKLLTTRAGRDALLAGQRALARVDDHLQSVTGQRNPAQGKTYGVYADNPTSFAGVMRALEQSSAENDRLKALPAEAAEDRKLLFTPVIELKVTEARDGLAAILGARVSTRAALSRGVTVKDETRDEALKTITAVRQHLYANLPDQKQDDDLREYGFRPLSPSGGRRGTPTDPAPAPTPIEPEPTTE